MTDDGWTRYILCVCGEQMRLLPTWEFTVCPSCNLVWTRPEAVARERDLAQHAGTVAVEREREA